MLSVIKVKSMNEGKEKKPSGKKVNVWAIILIVSAIYVLTRLVRSVFSMSAYQKENDIFRRYVSSTYCNIAVARCDNN